MPQNTLLSVFVLSVLSSQAYGWGDIGHAAVGEIAERNLTEKGAGLVCQVLGGEPLSVAATFPDHVRSDPRYRAFAPYHFLEIVPPMSPTEALAKSAGKKNAHAMIVGAPDFINRPGVPAAQQQLYLRYLVHMVGDVHQPLHVGNGWDMGANLCEVNFIDPETGASRKTNLHSVIDDGIFEWEKQDFDKANKGRPGKYYGYQPLVDSILSDTSAGMKATKADLPEAIKLGPVKWYEEAQALHPSVYKDKTPVKHPKERPYCKLHDPVTGKYIDGAYKASEVPTLDESFARAQLAMAKQQILKGGHRLAALINEMAERFPPKLSKADCQNALDAANQIEKHTQYRQPDTEKPAEKPAEEPVHDAK